MLKVNELFAGIGGFRAALERLGIEHEVVGISEVDKFAIRSYNAIYGETRNYGDISKVDHLDYADMWTYGFPCQDISKIGLRKGIVKGETRSGLLFEVMRLLDEAKERNELPKYLVMENVRNLVSEQFYPNFMEWVNYLFDLGYITNYQILNTKDYGIPQNRERVFAVSIRKDVCTGFILFPEPMYLKFKMRDFLESNVSSKYIVKSETTQKYIEKSEKLGGTSFSFRMSDLDGVAFAITTNPTINTNNYVPVDERYYLSNQTIDYVVDKDGKTDGTGWERRLNTVKLNPDCAYALAVSSASGRQRISTFVLDDYDTEIPRKKIKARVIKGDYPRMRRLTALECWRLQGFTDEQYQRAAQVVSESQLYKQAGNAVTVDVVYYLFQTINDMYPLEKN